MQAVCREKPLLFYMCPYRKPTQVDEERILRPVSYTHLDVYKRQRTETAMEHIPEYLRVSQAERERAEREKEQKPAGTKI